MSEIKNPSDTTLDPKLRSLLDDQLPEPAENFIYCATCSHVITTIAEKIGVHGQHEHFCVNPHGFEFHVGCFSQALGCDITGPSYAADSWFMGYAWKLATCAQCQTHLGWYFTATGASVAPNFFYGLILDKLQEEP